MKISVIGLGYVGAVTAACLARDGHEVLGIDLDPAKLGLLREGKAPIVEEGIDAVVHEAVASGRLRVTDQMDAEVAACDLIFVCVGTPSSANGSQDLSAVRRVSAQLGEALRACTGFPVVVLRSTVYPGSTEEIVKPALEEYSGRKAGVDFGLCFQPEFLREGSSIEDFYDPPFTVVGSDSGRSIEAVHALFEGLPGEFVATGFAEAEMLKITCNVFHALKISFANEIGRLARNLGVDSRKMMSVFCTDTSLNISPAYLRPGFAFGGSCLPKDLRAMLYLAKQHDVDLPLIQGVERTNELHIRHAADIVMASGSRKVGMVGLSFKPGTDDLRESPLVALAETLIGKGYDLRIYDPAVNLARLIGSNKRFIEETIPHIEMLLMDNLGAVFDHARVVVVGQNHPDLPGLLRSGAANDLLVVDLVGLQENQLADTDYSGICW